MKKQLMFTAIFKTKLFSLILNHAVVIHLSVDPIYSSTTLHVLKIPITTDLRMRYCVNASPDEHE